MEIKNIIIFIMVLLLVGSITLVAYNDKEYKQKINGIKETLTNKTNELTNLNLELQSVNCWNETCTEKTTEGLEGMNIITKDLSYKNELAYVVKADILNGYEDVYSKTFLREELDVTAEETLGSKHFGREYVYVDYKIYDSEGSLYFTLEKGTKPDWLEE